MTSPGRVDIVGAGPGGLAYLTWQAVERLCQAQVLVYDALVNPELLALLPPDCDQIDMGKRGGRPSPAQAEIDRLLVELCRQGKQVVRLKSGDPFIFGRTASEIQALKQANCQFALVPGLSSALAAPLLAAIPLTDPVLSYGFGVVTAHNPDQLDWGALSRLPTLVILMGSRQLPRLIRQLLDHGKRADTPIAMIRWAGHPQQQVWEGTLLNIEQIIRGEILSPCIIVIGEVVKLRPYLLAPTTPPPSRSLLPPVVAMSPPLCQKTVLITRSAGQSSQFADLLTEAGATVVELPALEIRPPSSWQPLDQAIATLGNFHWLILTSANAVTYFMERLQILGKDSRDLAGLKLAVVGKKTAGVLQQWGLRPDFVPPDFVAEALIDHFPEPVAGLRLLFPRVESGGREVLVQTFTTAGAEVVEVPAYESGCPERPDPQALAALQQGQVDVITFASSKTVRHSCRLLAQGAGESWRNLITGVAIAAIGPKTADTCRELLGRVDLEPAEYTLEGLTQEIIQWANSASSV